MSPIHSSYGRYSRLPTPVRLAAAAVAACFLATPALSNPVNPTVVRGSASFSQAGNVLTVTNSNGAIINWDKFSIKAGETTHFAQPAASSSVLNRVLNDPTAIYGTLSSNGRVWLINPAGIMIGAGGRIDTAGFVASTLNLSNDNFLAGRKLFDTTPGAGNVINQGEIRTPAGGSVYLIGSNVSNEGIITTPKGETILAAGSTVSLIDSALPGVKVDITGAAGSATNLGEITAEAGRIGIAGVIVRNSGTLNASSVVNDGGRIFLKASQDAYVDGNGRIVTTGTKGGQVEVLGNRVAVMDSASIDASGATGGGKILVGGDYQGKNPDVQNASITYFGPKATLKADATEVGAGGTAIVWADDTTRAYGSISAKGGVSGGDGGFIETSGHWLDVAGIVANASAPKGAAGTWLLDPYNLTVTATPPTNAATASGPPYSFTSGYGGSNVLNTDINAQLNTGTSVTLQTSGTAGDGFGNGDITVSAAITKTSGGTATLLLKAHNDIIVSASTPISSTVGALNVTLNSDSDGNGSGAIVMNGGSSVLSNGGNITLGGGANPLVNPAVGNATNRNGVNLTSAVLRAGVGNINIRGTGVAGIANTNSGILVSATEISTTSGSIMLEGTGGAGAGGFDNNKYGIRYSGFGGIITSDTGSIALGGTGGGSTFSNVGVFLDGGPITSTVSAPISIIGNGGPGSSGALNYGVLLGGGTAGLTISSVNGAVSINGTATGTSGSEGVRAFGYGQPISIGSTGIAPLSFTGAGSGGSSNSSFWIDGSSGVINIGGPSASGQISFVAGGVNQDVAFGTGVTIQGTGNLSFKPQTDSTTIGIGSGAGTFNLSATDLAAIQPGFAGITVGSALQTGLITLGTASVNGNLTLLAQFAGGDIKVDGSFTQTAATPTVLALNAGRDILFGDGTTRAISVSSTNPLTMELNAGNTVTTTANTTLSVNGSTNTRVWSGKTWENHGTISLQGASFIDLDPTQTGTSVATLHNMSDGTVILNSTAGWVLQSNSSFQNGVIQNDGLIDLQTTVAFENIYNQAPTGTLAISANNVLSMQNAGTIYGGVSIGTNGRLVISEVHAGARMFDTATITGPGTIDTSVTTTFANTVLDSVTLANSANAVLNGATLANRTGNLTVPSGMTYAYGGNVGFVAYGDLIFNSSVTIPGPGDLKLVAGWDGTSSLSAPVIGGAGSGNLSVNQAYVQAGSMSRVEAKGLLSVSGGTVGAGLNSLGNQDIKAASIAVTGGTGGNNAGAFIRANGDQQIATTAGGMTLSAAATGSVYGGYATIVHGATSGNQLIEINGGALTVYGGGGTGTAYGAAAVNLVNSVCAADASCYGQGISGNYAGISNNAGMTTLNMYGGAITLLGGFGGTMNKAYLSNSSSGTQTILGASAINLTGGTSGGNNYQSTDGFHYLRNNASIFSPNGPQTISATSIALNGAGASPDQNTNSSSGITGQSQAIDVTGAINVIAGTTAAASAGIQSLGGQSITAATIALNAGNGAGVLGGYHDASAEIRAAGVQNVTLTGTGTVLSIVAGGDSGGYNNFAGIRQTSGTSGSQTITLQGANATVSLQGGSGDGLLSTSLPSRCYSGGVLTYCDASLRTSNNSAFVYNSYGSQILDFQYGGALNLTGGSNGIFNYAQVYNSDASGQQKIGSSNGSANNPDIALTGGASGGAIATYGGVLAYDASGVPIYLRNGAWIQAPNATIATRQTIDAGTLTLTGAGDANTYGGAYILAPFQDVAATGNITLTGGAGSNATLNSLTGAVIGSGYSAADVLLSTQGSLSLTGGTGQNSGALIGSRQFGATVIADVAVDIFVAAGTGARAAIGSAEGHGGTVTLRAGRDILFGDDTVITNGPGSTPTAPMNVTLLAQRDILLGQSGNNLYGGNLVLMSGWDGSTAIPLATGAAASGGYGGSIRMIGANMPNSTSSSVTAYGDLVISATANVGAGFYSTGAMDVAARNISLTAGYGGDANITLWGAGTQNITATNTLSLTAAASSGSVYGSSAHISAGNATAYGGTQTITAGNIALTAGGTGTSGFINENIAGIAGFGPQVINVTNGGIVIQGGGAGTAGSNNYAGIHHGDWNGTTAYGSGNLTINLQAPGGGSIAIYGGSGTGNQGEQDFGCSPSPCLTSSNFAGIGSDIGNLVINTPYGGTIALNAGGAAGDYGNNDAFIRSRGSLTIGSPTGRASISLTGGAAGGQLGFDSYGGLVQLSNSAGIGAEGSSGNNLTVYAGDITLSGGSAAYGGAYLAGKTAVTIDTSGNLALNGGSGNNTTGNPANGWVADFAVIGNDEDSPIINLNVGGNLTVTGGTGTGSAALIGSLKNAAAVTAHATGNITLASNGGSGAGIGSLGAYGGYVNLSADQDISFANNTGVTGNGTSAPMNVKLLAKRDVALGANAYDAYGGSILVMAGWDGASPFTAPLLANSAPVGGNGGSLTLNGTTLRTSGTGDLLLAAYNVFSNYGGPTALDVTGSGRWLVYSSDPANYYGGGLTPTFREYGATGPSSSHAGNGLLFGLTPALSLTLSGTTSRTYDSTVYSDGSGLTLTASTAYGDSITYSGTFAYDTKNVGTNKQITATATTATGSAMNSGIPVYGLGSAAGTATAYAGTITAAPLVLNALTDTRQYNGTAGSALTPTAAGLFTAYGDSISGLGQSFDSKNAGARTLSVNGGYVLNDGNAGGNYLVTTSTASGTITQLASVAWVGGSTGNWSAAANWSGGAIPDAANVAAVTIPSGTFVTFDGANPATTLTSLSSTGATLGVAGSSLAIGSGFTLAGYQQSGGTFTANGMTVTQNFTQTGGTLAVSGPLAVNQSNGNLTIINSVPLVLGAVTVGSGNLIVDNMGAITTGTSLVSASGSVSLTAHSPITIGSGGISAGNSVQLSAPTAGPTSDLVVNGPVNGGSGSVALNAYGTIAQNANITGSSVSVGSSSGSIVMAPAAMTQATAGGIAYSAPTGYIVLASLNAGTGSVAVDAGGAIMSAPGFTGTNITGGAVHIGAGSAQLTTDATSLDVNVSGSFNITNNGITFTDAPPVSNTDSTRDLNSAVNSAQTDSTPTESITPPPPTDPLTSSTAGVLANASTGGTEGSFGGEEVKDTAKDAKRDDKDKKSDQAKDEKKNEKSAAKKVGSCGV